ncbi:hypothetical protein ACWENA_01725 [Streptomyces sp. NPDC004779]
MSHAGRWKKPHLPEGPVRAFKEALHALHVRAGAPGVQTVGKCLADLHRRGEAPLVVSGSTAYSVITASVVHRWDTALYVVRVLAQRIPGADRESVLAEEVAFHLLWLKAWSSEEPSSGNEDVSVPPPTSRPTGAGEALAVTVQLTGHVVAGGPGQDSSRVYRAFFQAVLTVTQAHGAARTEMTGEGMTAVFTGPGRSLAAAKCAWRVDAMVESVLFPAVRSHVAPLLGAQMPLRHRVDIIAVPAEEERGFPWG